MTGNGTLADNEDSDEMPHNVAFGLNVFLSVTVHINCSVAGCLINFVYLDMCLYQVIMTLHSLNDVANDTESTQKIENYVLIASLKSESVGKLINII